MKAIVYREYGAPEVLKYEEIEKPVAAENEVLIKVVAASVNPLDWHFIRGTPTPMRLGLGLTRPKIPRVGADVAGVVEAAGKAVTRFKPGDAVFGTCRGAFAEYACAPEASLAIKPENVTFEQAAAAPIAGLTALQGLRDKAHLAGGQKVLVNGASGGVGSFAVQMAKAMGAEVTGVCSTANVAMVRRLGADRVIDYTRDDFITDDMFYDAVFDTVGNRPIDALRRVMAPKSVCIGIAGGRPGDSMLSLVPRMLAGMASSWFSGQKFAMLIAKANGEDLAALGRLMAAGKVTPVIDRCYKLSEVPAAVRHVETGHARGKVVVTVGAV